MADYRINGNYKEVVSLPSLARHPSCAFAIIKVCRFKINARVLARERIFDRMVTALHCRYYPEH